MENKMNKIDQALKAIMFVLAVAAALLFTFAYCQFEQFVSVT